MSIAAAPMRLLTVEEWHDLFGDYEGGHCELVRGRAIMTPTEATENSNAIVKLIVLLDPTLCGSWATLPNTSVRLRGGTRPTVRIPDLVVLPKYRVGTEWQMLPSDIAMVVEVVSPSSVERDWVTKREEYAAAGIPNYLIIDVRGADGPRLWLFDELVEGSGAGAATTYADTSGDGTSVTIRFPGVDPITITATDLAQ